MISNSTASKSINQLDNLIKDINELLKKSNLTQNEIHKDLKILDEIRKICVSISDYEHYIYKIMINEYKDNFYKKLFLENPQLEIQEGDGLEEMKKKFRFNDDLWANHSYSSIHKKI